MFRWDPCGLLCVCMIYFCVSYADYVVLIWLLIPTFKFSCWTFIYGSIYNILLLCTTVAHIRAMTTDPGVVPISKSKLDKQTVPYNSDESESDEEMMMRGYGRSPSDHTLCQRCESLRPPRAHHCRICKRCIRKMDHHCPWINNCVGEYNQKYFLQFCLYVGACCIFSLFIIAICWVFDDAFSVKKRFPMTDVDHHKRVIHSIMLTMESALFGLFVLAVSCDQLGAIFTDETAIEAVQRRTRNYLSSSRRPRSSKVALLRQVCGPGPKVIWVLPCLTAPRKAPRYLRSHHQLAHFEV